jgi:predicted Rossmann-fold nucleotide-binding protein
MIIACSADAVIAVSGGCGTLSELSMAWQYGKPIAVMEGLPGITGFLIGKSLDSGPLDTRRKDKIIGAKSASKAVSLITKILEKAK